ncbi:hypothetical protein [Dyella amyloliquefaciens]|uniref:hypothetical protein n=1 Tax=Dyella amyloliquefaciens TaxID=1770545 RepID=UPI00102E5FAC|nr:hypothetical protein [Dyella amyloliquefaciens]
MSRRIPAVCMLLVSALTIGPAFAGPPGCGLPELSNSGELQRFLSLRAVEVVKLAAGTGEGLAAWVDPSASFNLGTGDVGRSMGTGVDGARTLAHAMQADSYRFLGWDYMNMPADPCSRQKVEVEFVDSQAKIVSRVEFTFEAGRVVNAEGWLRSFETGRL